jgi:hypothetical protein
MHFPAVDLELPSLDVMPLPELLDVIQAKLGGNGISFSKTE